MPKVKWDKMSTNYYWLYFVLSNYSWSWGVNWSVVSMPSESPLGKTDSFLVRARVHVHSLSPRTGRGLLFYFYFFFFFGIGYFLYLHLNCFLLSRSLLQKTPSPISPPPASMQVHPHPPTHPVQSSCHNIPLHWDIKHHQAQGLLLLSLRGWLWGVLYR